MRGGRTTIPLPRIVMVLLTVAVALATGIGLCAAIRVFLRAPERAPSLGVVFDPGFPGGCSHAYYRDATVNLVAVGSVGGSRRLSRCEAPTTTTAAEFRVARVKARASGASDVGIATLLLLGEGTLCAIGLGLADADTCEAFAPLEILALSK